MNGSPICRRAAPVHSPVGQRDIGGLPAKQCKFCGHRTRRATQQPIASSTSDSASDASWLRRWRLQRLCLTPARDGDTPARRPSSRCGRGRRPCASASPRRELDHGGCPVTSTSFRCRPRLPPRRWSRSSTSGAVRHGTVAHGAGERPHTLLVRNAAARVVCDCRSRGRGDEGR